MGESMRVLDLFSGIGGFSLGLESAGMKTIAFCEIEPFCRKILDKHWPGVEIHEDIKKLDGKQYRGAVDVVCGGYPCQPFSVAGKQKGKKDERHLWPEMFRIITECAPAWVIAENVVGHVKMGLDDVYSDLESEGYAVESIIIPACATGKNHQRERLWILAYSASNGFNGGSEPRGHGQTNERTAERKAKAKYAERRCGIRPELGGCSDKESKGGIKPRICREYDGLSDRVDRIKSLGNSVVPQIVEKLGKLIIDFNKSLIEG